MKKVILITGILVNCLIINNISFANYSYDYSYTGTNPFTNYYYYQNTTKPFYHKSYYQNPKKRHAYKNKKIQYQANDIKAKEIKTVAKEITPTSIATGGEQLFVFNPRIHRWAAYDSSGKRLAEGIANGGDDYCPDINRRCYTPTGTYRILSKGGADCISTRYPIVRKPGYVKRGGAHMPYCMYFHEKGYAVHGYAHLTNANVSHGCIRVSNDAAKWLNSSFMRVGTKVRVLSY